jgi:hypothetical protein
LPYPQFSVQAIHAALENTRKYPLSELHPTVVLCAVKNEYELYRARGYLLSHQIDSTIFYEPDRDNEATAFATRPVYENERNMFKRFQLLKG